MKAVQVFNKTAKYLLVSMDQIEDLLFFTSSYHYVLNTFGFWNVCQTQHAGQRRHLEFCGFRMFLTSHRLVSKSNYLILIDNCCSSRVILYNPSFSHQQLVLKINLMFALSYHLVFALNLLFSKCK